MEVAIKSVAFFLLLYFSYYFALRFIQSVFQGFIGSISPKLSKFIYALSTPAHELAHLFVAVLCLARIEQVQLFPKGNRPGFVNSRISGRSPLLISIREFLISIAPVIINVPLFILIESKFVLKGDISRIVHPEIMLTKEGFITVLLFLVLLSGIAPSNADFKGMIKGLVILCVVIFALSYLTAMIFNVRAVNVNPIIIVIFYYLEIIGLLLILNVIFNYKNCFRIIGMVIMSSLKHAFEWK